MDLMQRVLKDCMGKMGKGFPEHHLQASHSEDLLQIVLFLQELDNFLRLMMERRESTLQTPATIPSLRESTLVSPEETPLFPSRTR